MFIVFFEKIQFNKTLRYDDYENINIYYPLSVSIRSFRMSSDHFEKRRSHFVNRTREIYFQKI